MIHRALALFGDKGVPAVLTAAGTMIVLQIFFGRAFDLVTDLVIMVFLYKGWTGKRNP